MEEPVWALDTGALTCTTQIGLGRFQSFFYTRFKWAGQIWPSCQNFSNYLSTSSFETQLVLR